MVAEMLGKGARVNNKSGYLAKAKIQLPYGGIFCPNLQFKFSAARGTSNKEFGKNSKQHRKNQISGIKHLVHISTWRLWGVREVQQQKWLTKSVT
jgi:hypothetical protein